MRSKIALAAFAAATLCAVTLSARYGPRTPEAAAAAYGLEEGTPALKSAGALTFGPDGILFVGDSTGAAVFAIEVGTGSPSASQEPVALDNVDRQIAALLGTAADQVRINDMAVQRGSQDIYFSITRGRGADSRAALVRYRAGTLERVALEGVRFSQIAIDDAPDATAKTSWGAAMRPMSITDLAYARGRVYVAGLSREQFGSKFRSAAFPFDGRASGTSVEIFHASHGRYETQSPIETFMPIEINGREMVLAGYGCAPIAFFDAAELTGGKLVRGRTVAELGGGNRPLDMIELTRNGERVVIVANSDRTLMRIKVTDLAAAPAITTAVKDIYVSSGVPYVSIATVGVMQLDDLNAKFAVAVQRDVASGALKLTSLDKRGL